MTEPSRLLAQATRRFADQQSAKLEDLPNDRHLRATVTTVNPGAGAGGGTTVTVTWRGGEYLVAGYPDSYTPAVGHRVLCVIVGDQLEILHRSIGGP